MKNTLLKTVVGGLILFALTPDVMADDKVSLTPAYRNSFHCEYDIGGELYEIDGYYNDAFSPAPKKENMILYQAPGSQGREAFYNAAIFTKYWIGGLSLRFFPRPNLEVLLISSIIDYSTGTGEEKSEIRIGSQSFPATCKREETSGIVLASVYGTILDDGPVPSEDEVLTMLDERANELCKPTERAYRMEILKVLIVPPITIPTWSGNEGFGFYSGSGYYRCFHQW